MKAEDFIKKQIAEDHNTKQMVNRLDALEQLTLTCLLEDYLTEVKKMSVMRCSKELKDKSSMTFEEWIKHNKETEIYNAFLDGGFNFSLGALYKQYAKEINKPLIA